MKQTLNYVTYQTFPASTANSLQSISNIKYFIKKGINVCLYFPLREKTSSGDLKVLQEYYSFTESLEIKGVNHYLPHGRIQIFKKTMFHISHFLWSKRTISKYFKKNNGDIFFTRSDWIAFFAARKKYKVIFECHQESRIRNFVIKKIGDYENVYIIFLNKDLQENYKNISNSTVLHNGVDVDLFEETLHQKRNSIVYAGNLSRFGVSRGFPEFLKKYNEEKVFQEFNLEIIGGDLDQIEELKTVVEDLNIEDYVIFHGRKNRSETINIIQMCKIGLLLNNPNNTHSYQHTSPLKYFEYIYAKLSVIALDFPSHRSLPLNQKISYFDLHKNRSLNVAINQSQNNDELSAAELKDISLETRIEKILDFAF